MWERAIEIYQGPIPAGRVLLHRDYHPGNVLWRRGRVTGVVDWVNTSLGVGDADAGHCRANLDIVGPGAADEFLARWLVVTGRDGYDPYWDLVAVVGTADSYSVTPDADLDRWVARAVAALG